MTLSASNIKQHPYILLESLDNSYTSLRIIYNEEYTVTIQRTTNLVNISTINVSSENGVVVLVEDYIRRYNFSISVSYRKQDQEINILNDGYFTVSDNKDIKTKLVKSYLYFIKDASFKDHQTEPIPTDSDDVIQTM